MDYVNSCDLIRRFFPDGTFHIDAWRAYADALSPTLGQKCLQDAAAYSFEDEILPLVGNALARSDKFAEAEKSFLAAARRLEDGMRRIWNTPPEGTALLYLGLGNGAGWATELDGRPAVLLGIEKIVELDWCREERMFTLIAHEAGHLWHFGNRREKRFNETSPALWQLYTEGVAMFCEQALADDPAYYRQYGAPWRAWCERNRRELFREYLSRVEKGAPVREFFGDWNSYRGHSDVGYYLGAELIRSLSVDGGPDGLADCTEAQILAALRDCAMKKE